MLKRVVLILALVAICDMRYANAKIYAQDKIVAVVNNDVITQKDLDDFASFMRMQLSREYRGEALEIKIESIKKDMLDKLIEDRLILQEAKNNKIVIDESRVKARINEIKKRYPTDPEFQSDLANQGMVQADLEKKIREQFLMYNIIDLKIRSKIIVRPDEVTHFYNENKKEFVTFEERELDAITLENSDQADSFSYNLKRGEKLEDLAVRYPVTINKINFSESTGLRKEIESEVGKLGVGEVSNPVKIEDKYCVFRLNAIIPPKELSLLESQGKIHEFIFNSKMQEGLTKWLDELKKNSYIKISQN
ncbi:MAG: peptidyl-prolyl cis-trans isomerase [Candidatus Omnitrophota bacterium]|mgnify:CR=1 FL=1